MLEIMMPFSEDVGFRSQHPDQDTRLQVCGLGPDGKYSPVIVVSQRQIVPGSSTPHQGLQRQIIISLSSNSGLQLPWSEFTKVRVGNLRLLDPQGRVHHSSSKGLVNLLPSKDQRLEFKPDGTGHAGPLCPWSDNAL
ncbi:hypothetical protein DL96DRAFT_890598 [Flagelloscypha sp. PMI_526]|nr:hypothetical protein DL96DRAFT_890598 [Flagelloscypha sp. PMI_526]